MVHRAFKAVVSPNLLRRPPPPPTLTTIGPRMLQCSNSFSNRRVCVIYEHFKVSLVPLASFRRRLESIRLSAEGIVADSAGVAGTIRLATRLDPHESIKQRRAAIGRSLRERTETGVNNVAPVAPFEAATGVARAAGVNDGVVGHAGGGKGRTKKFNVELFVLSSIVLSIWVAGKLAGSHVPLVPTSDVGGEASELGRRASVGVCLCELLSTGLEVLVPPEPATVTGIEVHDNVGQVQLLNGVGGALMVAIGGVLAALQVDVGDEVGQRIGLNDESEGLVGVGLDDVDND